MTLSDRYDCVLFDLDGVLYRGDEPIPGAAEALRRLHESGKGIAFLTNNSSRTPEQVAEKLSSFGMPVTSEEVVTSALATASLLAGRGGRSAFVVGELGIRTALANAGIEVVDGESEVAEYVVVGWDRSADYAKLKTAALLVQRGAKLVATNNDAAYPAADGLWPGAGALLAAVVTTTGAEAEVVGKPHPPLFEMARDRAGGGAVLFVGDRLDTDVAGAAALGWDTLLVFTGVTGPADLLHAATLPTFLGRDLGALSDEAPVIRPAQAGDRGEVSSLLRATGLDDRGVGVAMGGTVVAECKGRTVGTVTLERDGSSAHLRSLAVAEAERSRYIGTLLVAHGVQQARNAGARDVSLATETSERFFERLGFHRVGTLDALPDAFRRRMSFCADTAVVMRLEL